MQMEMKLVHLHSLTVTCTTLIRFLFFCRDDILCFAQGPQNGKYGPGQVEWTRPLAVEGSRGKADTRISVGSNIDGDFLPTNSPLVINEFLGSESNGIFFIDGHMIPANVIGQRT
jgi:hypothetical protein